MSFPAPTRRDHLRFCKVEGWEEVRSATGRAVRHHATFELRIPSGDILRTRISRSSGAKTYGARLWAHILRDQLHVSEDEFWRCVRDGHKPDRGAAPAPPTALPSDLVYRLRNDVGLPEGEIAAMSLQEAVERMQRYWTGEDRPK